MSNTYCDALWYINKQILTPEHVAQPHKRVCSLNYRWQKIGQKDEIVSDCGPHWRLFVRRNRKVRTSISPYEPLSLMVTEADKAGSVKLDHIFNVNHCFMRVCIFFLPECPAQTDSTVGQIGYAWCVYIIMGCSSMTTAYFGTFWTSGWPLTLFLISVSFISPLPLQRLLLYSAIQT